MKHQTGLDFQFERNGIIQLALNPEDEKSLQAEVARQKKMGLKAVWMDKQALQKRFSFLNPTHSGGALFEEDGQVDGDKFLTAMIQAARTTGVDIQEDVPHLQLHTQNHRIERLTSSKEEWTASHFVLTAGAWSDELLEPLGLRLGLEPIRGQLVYYETPEPVLDRPLYTPQKGYVVPKKNGTTLVGSTIEHVGFDDTSTEKAKRDLIQQAQELVPALKGKTVSKATAALRPGTPDDLPFLGPLPQHPNLIVAAGHYRNRHSPGPHHRKNRRRPHPW